MKVKLLKKVRKRYSITRVDDIASNASDYYKQLRKTYGCPFYIIEDTNDSYGFKFDVHKTFDEAYQRVCEMVTFDYSEKFRHKDGKETKVWHNKKK